MRKRLSNSGEIPTNEKHATMTKFIAVLTAFENKLDRRVAALSGDENTAALAAQTSGICAAYLKLGKDMTEAGHIDEGLRAGRKALQLAPDNLEANYFMARKLERLSRVDEAWQTLVAFENRCGPLDGDVGNDTLKKLYLLEAHLEHRRGNLEVSCAMLQQFVGNHPQHALLSKAYGWLGKALDGLGEHDAAMQAFHESNQELSRAPESIEWIDKSSESMARLETSLRWYRDKTCFGWSTAAIKDDLAAPVLLVGYPRSGTTLLDQILDSHGALMTLEEQPTLSGLRGRFHGNEENLQSLRLLADDGIIACRQTYWSNAAKFLDKPLGEARLVDKFPLNIRFLDIYARLFPDVKIIVALRDPRDVVLSNYMQMYKLNAEMAANLDLASSARFYASTMELYLLFRKFLPDNIYEIRYEDLVRDFGGESARLLDFLELEWDDNLLKFHEHAKNRWIKTPSYEQVCKPIYAMQPGAGISMKPIWRR
jgi:tetratricopeptide (TPR) repeat protein